MAYMAEQILRFTMPHDVADLLDLQGLDDHALRQGIAPLAYRRQTMAGIEIGCSRDFAPLLLGAIHGAASNPWHEQHRETCAHLFATLVDFLEKKAS